MQTILPMCIHEMQVSYVLLDMHRHRKTQAQTHRIQFAMWPIQYPNLRRYVTKRKKCYCAVEIQIITIVTSVKIIAICCVQYQK